MSKSIIIRSFTDDQFQLDKIFYNNSFKIKRVNPESNYSVIDVGAHIGYFSLVCLFSGYSKLFCFEPFIENYKTLLKNLEQFNLEYKNYDSINTTQIAIVPITTASNTILINYPILEKGKILDFSNIETHIKKEKYHVAPSTKLDNILNWYVDKDIKLLKINVDFTKEILCESELLPRQVQNICGEYINENDNISLFQKTMKEKGYNKSLFIKNDIENIENKYSFWFSKNDLNEVFSLEDLNKK